MNALVGRKVSIVSHKPQTTRHRIQGVVNRPEGQIVFVDTPGLHQRETRRLNRAMNEQAMASFHDVDLIVRSEEHTSELQSLMRISYAVICLQQKQQRQLRTKRCINQRP